MQIYKHIFINYVYMFRDPHICIYELLIRIQPHALDNCLNKLLQAR